MLHLTLLMSVRRTMRVCMPKFHSRSSRSRKKLLGVLGKSFCASLRTEIVSFAPVLNFARSFGRVHGHPAHEVFNSWRAGKYRQTHPWRFWIHGQIGHVVILDDFRLHPHSSELLRLV